MLDLIDAEVLESIIADRFNVLDAEYVNRVCKYLVPEYRRTVNEAFETRYLIVEAQSGTPMKLDAAMKHREAANEFLKVLGDDKYTVALLLTER